MNIEDVSSALLLREPPPLAPPRAVADLVAVHRDPRTNTINYDKRAADLLAVSSAWAYSDAKMLSMMLARRGLYNYCHYIGISNDALFVDANAFLIQSECGRLAILCFRGTEPKNIINWLTDLSVNLDPFYSHGHVHGGFYRNVRAIWRNIAEAIENAMEGRPIHGDGAERDAVVRHRNGEPPASTQKLEALYITGHSLGAAMAALAAAIIFNNTKYERIREVLRAVYTFGQPMVGDAAFAEKCEHDLGGIVFRHVYGHDIVPRMPPLTTGWFEHFGEEYHSGPAGWEFRKKPVVQAYTAALSNTIGVGAWATQQLSVLRRLRMPLSWDDHSPLHYMRCSQTVEPGSEFD